MLHLKDAGLGLDERYRVSVKYLRKNSQYYDSMLDVEKFAEGIAIKKRLEELSTKYGPSTTPPLDELPMIAMPEIPEINHRVASTITLLDLFLFILHDETPPWPFRSPESMQSLAQLMLIADRFSAVEVTKRYVYEENITTSGCIHSLASSRRKDLQLRCKLLAGLYLGEREWIRLGSARLIVEGSHQWSLGSKSKEDEEDTPAWYHLPAGFEGQSTNSGLVSRTDLVFRGANRTPRSTTRYNKLHTKAFCQSILFKGTPMQERIQQFARVRLVPSGRDGQIFFTERDN